MGVYHTMIIVNGLWKLILMSAAWIASQASRRNRYPRKHTQNGLNRHFEFRMGTGAVIRGNNPILIARKYYFGLDTLSAGMHFIDAIIVVFVIIEVDFSKHAVISGVQAAHKIHDGGVPPVKKP